MKNIMKYLNLLMAFMICAISTNAQNYTQLANNAMADTANYSPVEFINNGGRINNKPGKYVWVGCSTDDPWMHPYIDIFRGADGGYDIICTVDPASAMPGENEIDAHVGSPDPNHPFQADDTPGDLFIIGDHQKPYYVSKQNASDPERDFVYIYRFQVGFQ